MQTRPQSSQSGVERFGRGDRRLVAVCVAVIVVGTAIGATLFSRAFPEASIDFRVTREEARRVAETALAARGFDVAGRKVLGIFDFDDEAKVFLERELGVSKAVPLLGRIMIVADAYSAMVLDRPYRRGLTVAQAVEQLRAGAGSQFDPAIVDALCDAIARTTPRALSLAS